jgi:hypothetical protein
MIGGIVGFIGYLFASTILDNREVTTEPSLSYGQQAALISLPMCTLISAATGLGIAFAINTSVCHVGVAPSGRFALRLGHQPLTLECSSQEIRS